MDLRQQQLHPHRPIRQSRYLDLKDLSPRPEEIGSSPSLVRGIAARFAALGLPIGGFDGGRILGAVLAPLTSEHVGARVVHVASYLSLFFLFSLSATCLLRYGENISLGVLCASLFVRIFLPDEGA